MPLGSASLSASRAGGLVLFALFVGVSLSADAAPVVLNEYNAASGSKKLDGGSGKDSFFGTIDGNGGNWFELIVIEDHVDVRGWKLNWTEDEKLPNSQERTAGEIAIGNDPLWSDLRSGTILTFIETSDGEGKSPQTTATDVSYDPAGGDWWINIATRQEQAKGPDRLVTTTTNDGQPGDFSVGKDDWMLTILDSQENVVFGPVGEGASTWAGDKISNEEGGSLEGPIGTDQEPLTVEAWLSITPASPLYDDTGSTSFGAPNVDYNSQTGFTPNQDVSVLRAVLGGGTPSGDFDGDGQLTAIDIDLLSTAVRTGSDVVRFDLNNDAQLDQEDRRIWVEQIRNTYFGDANLDGEFGSSDFISVLVAGEYEDDLPANSGWATGDWNGDAEFTTADFITALQGGGFERGPRGATAAVPEPASLVAILLAMVALLVHRRD